MLFKSLTRELAPHFDTKQGTGVERGKALRQGGLLSRGKRGRGVDMTSSDTVNLLLALALDHQRGDNVACNVRRVRNLPREQEFELPAGFTTSLIFFEAPTAGSALDGIFDDMRNGLFAAWTSDEKWDLKLSVDARGQYVTVTLSKEKRHATDVRDAIVSFARPDNDRTRTLVERQTIIRGELIADIAAKLGPP
jgi:hypothetical protein